MADAISITITNLPQIRAAFRRAPALMTLKLNEAIKKTLVTIESKGRKNTPVDTGRLRSSWLSKFSNLQGETGTHTNYDIFVHNGTKYMQARPYLYNAVLATESSVDKFFGTAVQNVLDEIGGTV